MGRFKVNKIFCFVETTPNSQTKTHFFKEILLYKSLKPLNEQRIQTADFKKIHTPFFDSIQNPELPQA